MSAAFEEAFNLLCGESIGRGMSREVFECALLPEFVVKVETDPHRFQNVLEWETWQRVSSLPASRWFAACKWISPNGRVLIQERTRPARPHELPKRMPIWFTDFKPANFGIVEARMKGGRELKRGAPFLVCHDYGVAHIVETAVTCRATQVAAWYE